MVPVSVTVGTYASVQFRNWTARVQVCVYVHLGGGAAGGGPDLVRLGSEALSDWANSVISGCFKRSIR